MKKINSIHFWEMVISTEYEFESMDSLWGLSLFINWNHIKLENNKIHDIEFSWNKWTYYSFDWSVGEIIISWYKIVVFFVKSDFDKYWWFKIVARKKICKWE